MRNASVWSSSSSRCALARPATISQKTHSLTGAVYGDPPDPQLATVDPGLDRLGERGEVDWTRASVDTMSVRANRGEDHVAANPIDRGKPGSKLHLGCDGGGLPLSVVTAANVNDTTMFQAAVDDIPPIRTSSGRRRTRPAKVHTDKGYDSRVNRAYLCRRGITPRIARRGVESSTRLGRHRWKVERALSWLSCWRRLQVRWDRDAGRWFAFVLVARAVVCFNRL